jgi:gliding motility-associated-like protein
MPKAEPAHKHITFIENKRQWDEKVRFKSEMRGGALFFETNAITYSFTDPAYLDKLQAIKTGSTQVTLDSLATYYAYQMRFMGANANPKIEGHVPKDSYLNYYIGSDSSRWSSHVKQYEEITYKELYPGITLLLYEKDATYKYEFIIAKAVNPSLIQMHYEGADKVRLQDGNLLVQVGKHQTIERAPFAYQEMENGEKQKVECRFVRKGNTISFSVGKYNPEKELIIDPTLVFASYSGSVADNWGYTATYDYEGNLYGGGTVYASGYPATLGVFQAAYGGGSCDIAITKFSSDGTQNLFSTYLGGSNADAPHSLVVNSNNELYVLASTSSSNYPVTTGAYDVSFNGGTAVYITSQNYYSSGSDIAISHFNASGTQLLASTYFGGSGNDGLNTALARNYADEIRGEIQVDATGNIYVVSSTFSTDLPVTVGVFQSSNGGNQDGFLAKFSANLQNLVWCSYFGGNSNDAIYSMELDHLNNIYICGGTLSSNLAVTAGAVYASNVGITDGFMAKVAANGTALLACTYYGSSVYDQTYLITLDKDENVTVIGQTEAAAPYWVNNATWSQGRGQFLSKLSNNLTQIMWSTSFGDSTRIAPNISPTALMVDICGNIHISGWGGLAVSGYGSLSTLNLPVTAGAIQTVTDGHDFYFITISADASNLVYATFFGGSTSQEHVDGGTSRFDKKGYIYQAVCAGCGRRQDFPTTPGVVSQTNNSDNCNLGVIKLNFNLQTVVADFAIPSVVCCPMTIAIENRSKGISDSTTLYIWDYGDGTTDTTDMPYHFYEYPGIYNITLIVYDPTSCNIADTISKRITVVTNKSTLLPTIDICKGDSVHIGVSPSIDPDVCYQWSPQAGLSDDTIPNPVFIDTVSRRYTLLSSTPVCIDTFFRQVNVIAMPPSANISITRCLGDTLLYMPDTSKSDFYVWSSNPLFTDTLNASTDNPWLEQLLQQTDTTYYLLRGNNNCFNRDTLHVKASSFELFFRNTFACYGDTIRLSVKVKNMQYSSSYSYQWTPDSAIIGSNQVSNPFVYSLSSAFFQVKLTNEHGCMMQDSLFVRVVELQSDITLNQISCYGLQDGSISIVTTGGDLPYSYQWQHTTTNTAYVDNLPPSQYRVRIIDSNSCFIDTGFILTEPDVLSLLLEQIVDTVFCDEICKGEALATASGGTPPYSFAWITGDTTAFLGNLCAGDYFLMLRDKNGCRDSLTFVVSDTSEMEVTYTTKSVSCLDKCDGAIQLEMVRGVFPCNYVWTTGDSTDFVDSLCKGIYDVSVTDFRHCTRRLFPKVEAPDLIKVDSIIIVHPYCHGMKDGSITVYAKGGTPPCTYWWNGEAGTNVLSGLDTAGKYTLTILDANSCQWDTVIYLQDYDTLSMQYQSQNLPCNNRCIGSAIVEATGGMPPYTYLWFDGSIDTCINKLCEGTYTVTAYDINHCEITIAIDILIDSTYFPQEIEAWSDQTIIYRSQSTTLYGSDYGNGFIYVWSPPDYLNTTNGTKVITTPENTIIYTYTVSDGDGCLGSDTVLITVMDVICDEPYVFVPNAFSPNGDRFNDILYVRGDILEKVEFAIYDRWGEKLFETNDKNTGWDGTFRGKVCDPGVYVYYLNAVCIGGFHYIHKGNITLIR